jgi:hypothetical protein
MSLHLKLQCQRTRRKNQAEQSSTPISTEAKDVRLISDDLPREPLDSDPTALGARIYERVAIRSRPIFKKF